MILTLTGTIINVITITIGGMIGFLLGHRLPDRIRIIFFQGIGLFTLFLGFTMALRCGNPLVLVLSMITGGLLGEWMHLEERLDSLAAKVKASIGGKGEHFTQGMITAFLLFCMGSMTILGAMEEGLGGSPDLLITKSIMDGLSAIALTAALGIGVVFSVIPLVIYQGGLTLLAQVLEPFLSDAYINEISASGGLILIGLGLQILEIKKFRIVNFLPALIMALLLTFLLIKAGIY